MKCWDMGKEWHSYHKMHWRSFSDLKGAGLCVTSEEEKPTAEPTPSPTEKLTAEPTPSPKDGDAIDASSFHTAAIPIPAQLTVKSPNGQQQVQGPYLLQDERANGMPLWRQKGGHFWIYGMTNGMWGFGRAEERAANFNSTKAAVCCRTPHDGMLPHRMPGHWVRWDGEGWLKDP